jgi:flagellar motor switch protein FliM
MAKILTQEEVDALLEAVAEGEEGALPDVEEPRAPERAVPMKKFTIYNFRRPERISKEQLRSLHFMHDRFARNFSASLSAYLRTITEVNLVSVEQLSYAEFLLSLPDPTSFNAVSMKPLEGNAALELGPSLVFPMIDKLLGGPGLPLEIDRSITEIEQNIIEGVIKLALEDLMDIWRPTIEVEMRVEARETSPQLIQIVAPNEVVVLIVFEVKIGEVSGMMNFCVPTSLIEPIIGKFDHDLSSGPQGVNDPDQIIRMKRHLLSAKQTVSAEIMGTSVTINDLVNLRRGDLIMLDYDGESDIFLSVGAVPKLSGAVIGKSGQRCFMVKERMSTGSEEGG